MNRLARSAGPALLLAAAALIAAASAACRGGDLTKSADQALAEQQAKEDSDRAASEEAAHLRREPAYGNLAELGFGVLAGFGLEPVGEILLDEKLGLHIAFGRSDHFGGAVGPQDFSSPAEVIHLDRIYIPQSQPRIAVRSVVLIGPDAAREEIMRDGAYRIFGDRP